ncbi:MAG: lectin like domain-containing protein [Planctomycetota bacterium]|jgi:C1A family cysteine protease
MLLCLRNGERASSVSCQALYIEKKQKQLGFSQGGIFDKGIAMPQRTAFERCLLTSSLALIISGFCVGLLVQAALAQPPVPPPPLNTAPVNPAFIAWHHALGHIPVPFDRSHLQSQVESAQRLLSEPPSSYDLRLSGYVTAVRDQGSCGSCWTFSTYGSMESWLLKNEAQSWDFSENHLKNDHGFDFGPCEGGNADMSTAYLARWSGPVDELDDPYNDWDDRPSPGGPSQKYLKTVLWFTTDSDIKNAVMTYGGLYVAMTYESGSYNPSEYTYYYSGTDVLNHGVTLIGWDDSKAVTGAPGNGAWLIKNSWGPSWGDQGYFWISYYDTMAVEYAVAFCDAVPTSSYATNYQYDPLGWTNSAGYDSSIAWAANVFTATADEDLTAIALYAVDDNLSYEIYIYDDFDGSTFSSLMGSTSGTLINSGYHTISLPSVINLTNADDFSVVVKFTTTGYGYPIPVEDIYPGYSSAATANPGESYESSSGSTFNDVTDTFPNANVCIKALTVPPPMTSPVITSTPVTVATVDELYSYDVDATGYPTPTFSLTTYPSGMTIDPNNGLIEWTPDTTGDFDVNVEASNGQPPDANQAFTITVSETPAYLDDLAEADIAVQGTVSGSHTDTQSSNDGYEAITEVRQGNPARGFSSLEHKWTINVTGGETVTFYLEAYQTISSDADNFVFAYSTDDSTYTDMLTVSKTSDDDTSQSYELPGSLSGTVYIRVIDTDSGIGNQDMDTIYIDHMYIRSTSSYTLTVNTVGGGLVTRVPDQATYTYGTEVTLTAEPNTGWSFESWSGDLTGSVNPDTITMNADKTVNATFGISQYTVTAASGANGSIAPAGDIIVNYGDDLAFTATPDIGYEADNWTVDGNSVQTGGTGYTLSNITADHTVDVTFKITQYNIFGYITEPDANIPLEGVFIDANSGGSDKTDANGYYELTVDYGWSGRVDPNNTGYTFEPNGIDYSNVTIDQNDSYIAILDTFIISGFSVDGQMLAPLDAVLVSPDNGGGPFTSKYYGGSDTTDVNGYYEVLVDYNWSGKVAPSRYAYVFEPNSITYANITEDVVEEQDYAGTLLTYTITGHIKNSCEAPIETVFVDANNGGGEVLTDPNGFYEVWVDYNWSGTVTPSKAHYTFDPNSNAYTYVLDDVIDQNYIATNIYDLNCDGSINLDDLAIMCEDWLVTGPDLPGDFYKDEDDIVNFLDFAEFGLAW